MPALGQRPSRSNSASHDRASTDYWTLGRPVRRPQIRPASAPEPISDAERWMWYSPLTRADGVTAVAQLTGRRGPAAHREGPHAACAELRELPRLMQVLDEEQRRVHGSVNGLRKRRSDQRRPLCPRS
jgi:hypothetical protein